MAIMADRGTATRAAMLLLITAGTPQRTATATLLRTTADIDRVTMLPPIMVPGTGALFAPDTHTMAPGTIAVIVIDDDRQATLFQVCRHFPPRIGLWQKSTAARKNIVLDANTARSGNDLNWGPAVALRPPHGRLGCALLISTDGPDIGYANHDWSSHGDGFGLMCIHYDQPDGAPPSRERYSGGEARAAGRALGKARKSLPMSAK